MGLQKPEELWEKQLGELFGKRKKSETEHLIDIVSLLIHLNRNDDMGHLYSRIGLKAFTEVIEVFGGRQITFIEKEELRENLILALCYYYREYKNMSWDEVKEKLPIEINTVSMGIRIGNLNKKVKREIEKVFAEMREENT